jgi:hypothetical protein
MQLTHELCPFTLQKAIVDELIFDKLNQVVLKSKPDSPAESHDDGSSSGEMVIDAQCPVSSSPVSGSATASQFSNTDDTESEASSFDHKRPYPVGASGPSKRPHYDAEDDVLSIASSANELKVLELRRKNNQASMQSRSKKKNRDHSNERKPQELEDHNKFLLRKSALLESARDKLREIIAERVNNKTPFS